MIPGEPDLLKRLRLAGLRLADRVTATEDDAREIPPVLVDGEGVPHVPDLRR
jgi:hypothetical protein